MKKMAKKTEAQKRADKKWKGGCGKSWMLLYNRMWKKLQRRNSKIQQLIEKVDKLEYELYLAKEEA